MWTPSPRPTRTEPPCRAKRRDVAPSLLSRLQACVIASEGVRGWARKSQPSQLCYSVALRVALNTVCRFRLLSTAHPFTQLSQPHVLTVLQQSCRKVGSTPGKPDWDGGMQPSSHKVLGRHVSWQEGILHRIGPLTGASCFPRNSCSANALSVAAGPPSLAVQAKCDPCLSSPCQNQGTCQNDPLEVYRCACPSGYKVSGGCSWRNRVLSAARQAWQAWQAWVCGLLAWLRGSVGVCLSPMT